jgi:hypothetical protein
VAPGEQAIIRCLTRRNSVWAPFEGAAAQSVFFPIDHFENGEPGYDGAFGMLAGPVSSASSVPSAPGSPKRSSGRRARKMPG